MSEYLEAGLFAVDPEARTIRGVLIPWGERSRLSVSKTKPLTFNRGGVPVPRDPSIVGLNRMHDRFDPVGRGWELTDEPVGMVATFRIADTPEGDAYLAEPGNLRRLSPEVRNIRRNPDGSATAELVGAALVDEGAFASAGLFAIGDIEDDVTLDDVASEVVTVAELADEVAASVSSTIAGFEGRTIILEAADGEFGAARKPKTSATAPAATAPKATPADTKEEDAVPDAQVPNTITGTGSGNGRTGKHTDMATLGANGMFAALTHIASGTATPELIERVRSSWGGGEAGMFALADIDYDGAAGVGAAMVQPAWLGEVTDGVEYMPLYADLFEQRDLTSLAMAGWDWITPPVGGDWTGNKDAIPSAAVDIGPVTANAARWAGGHDHAREHRDFNTPGYFESYWAKMTESFLKWLDGKTLVGAVATATALEADNPAGLAIGAGMSALIDGAAAVVAAGRVPTFGVVSTSNWKQILKTPNSSTLGYLDAALGLEKGTLDNAGFVIRPAAPAGLGAGVEALVGAKASGRVYRLPGSPIRAEALNIANGGIDTGAFGYGGFMPVNPDALVKVTTYTP